MKLLMFSIKEVKDKMKKTQKSYKGLAMEGMIAKWYTKLQKNDLDEYKNSAKIVVEKLKDGDFVLELASGPGYLAIEISKIGNFKVYGLDISKTFVQISKENATKENVNVNFQWGDASDMPFEDNLFDFVVNKSAFKNFTKPVIVINEIHRVLKDGGSAVIIDLRPDMHLSRINSFLTVRSLMGLTKNAHSKEEFKKFIDESNFTKYKIDETPMGYAIWLKK